MNVVKYALRIAQRFYVMHNVYKNTAIITDINKKAKTISNQAWCSNSYGFHVLLVMSTLVINYGKFEINIYKLLFTFSHILEGKTVQMDSTEFFVLYYIFN